MDITIESVLLRERDYGIIGELEEREACLKEKHTTIASMLITEHDRNVHFFEISEDLVSSFSEFLKGVKNRDILIQGIGFLFKHLADHSSNRSFVDLCSGMVEELEYLLFEEEEEDLKELAEDFRNFMEENYPQKREI